MLVFVVGGVEKIFFYVNFIRNFVKEFFKGMIFLVVMVGICVVLGLVVMGMLFVSDNIFKDLMVNGVYSVF